MGFATRYTKFFVSLIVFSAAWSYHIYNNCDHPDCPCYQTAYAFPGWLIVAFGCYTLLSIGKSLWDLVDYPEELDLLKLDVQRANGYWKT